MKQCKSNTIKLNGQVYGALFDHGNYVEFVDKGTHVFVDAKDITYKETTGNCTDAITDTFREINLVKGTTRRVIEGVC